MSRLLIDTQLLILHDLNHHMSFAYLEYCAFTIVSFGMRITTKGFIPASISCRYSVWTILCCLLRTICICAHHTGGSNNDILARQWAGHAVCHYHGDSFPLTCFAHTCSLRHCLKTPARTDPPYWPGHRLHAHRPGYPPDTTGSTHVRPLKKKVTLQSASLLDSSLPQAVRKYFV